MRALITAIRTLTILPVPGRDADCLAGALPFFPLVGGLVGAVVAAAVWAIAHYLHWPLGAGLGAVILGAALTGGLHLDGLADSFDALGGRTREARLAIMKDPRVGSFGVVALVLVLLAKTIAVARLAEFGQFIPVCAAFIISRALQVNAIVGLPYARAAAGTATPFVQGARPRHLYIATALAVLLCFLIGRGFSLLLLAVASVATLGLTAWMRRVFGGVTGDLVGALSELVEAGVLVLAAGMAPWILH